MMRPIYALLLLPLTLCACTAPAHPWAPRHQPVPGQAGATRPAAVAPASAKVPAAIARALAVAEETSALDRPYTARAVLTYGHAAARLLDAKAAFTNLTGTRIGVNGEPVRGGEWQLSYVGTEPVANPNKTRSNPYQQIFRRINIVVPADGKPRAEVVEVQGMPLGQCFYEAPMPEVDSDTVIDKVRELRPDASAQGGYRLVLTGLMSQSHFQELVWKVSRATQGADKPLMIHAGTGEPILR